MQRGQERGHGTSTHRRCPALPLLGGSPRLWRPHTYLLPAPLPACRRCRTRQRRRKRRRERRTTSCCRMQSLRTATPRVRATPACPLSVAVLRMAHYLCRELSRSRRGRLPPATCMLCTPVLPERLGAKLSQSLCLALPLQTTSWLARRRAGTTASAPTRVRTQRAVPPGLRGNELWVLAPWPPGTALRPAAPLSEARPSGACQPAPLSLLAPRARRERHLRTVPTPRHLPPPWVWLCVQTAAAWTTTMPTWRQPWTATTTRRAPPLALTQRGQGTMMMRGVMRRRAAAMRSWRARPSQTCRTMTRRVAPKGRRRPLRRRAACRAAVRTAALLGTPSRMRRTTPRMASLRRRWRQRRASQVGPGLPGAGAAGAAELAHRAGGA